MAQSNQAGISTPVSAKILSLPLELRQHIYGFCIPQNIIIRCSPTIYNDKGSQVFEYLKYDYRALSGLFLVCKQITDEVEKMFYGGNTFEISICRDGQEEFAKFGSKQREMIRKLNLVMRSTALSIHPDFRMDPQVWDRPLGNLSRLAVIAEQPNWEGRREKWMASFTVVLEYLRRALSSATQVVVDANGKEETIRVVEIVMPGRCHLQELPEGDVWFKRGGLLPEVDWDEYDDGPTWDEYGDGPARDGYDDGPTDEYDDGPTSCRDIISDADYDYYYSD